MANIIAFVVAGAGLVAPPPIFVNPYDPGLGGINCDSDCTHFGNGWRVVPELAGQVAACHPDWIGCTISFSNENGSAGPYLCIESGGALLKPVYHKRLKRTVQYVDIYTVLTGADGQLDYSRLPWWNNAVFDYYKLNCRG